KVRIVIMNTFRRPISCRRASQRNIPPAPKPHPRRAGSAPTGHVRFQSCTKNARTKLIRKKSKKSSVSEKKHARKIFHWFVVNDFCCSRSSSMGSSRCSCAPARRWVRRRFLTRHGDPQGRRRARVPSGGVLADGPAALGEVTLAGFDRRGFELGR